jgi:long-chain acyl-CoA synthetase
MGITTLADTVRVNGVERADHLALIQGDRQLTWGELLARSAKVAQALAAAGVGPTDRIAFLDKNSIEHFEVLFGAAMLNAVSVDVNWRLAPPEVEFIVNDADAKVLVVGPDFVPVLNAIAGNLPTVTTTIVIGGAEGYQGYEEWVQGFEATDPGIVATGDDIAFQLYSSGTTGRPKGVMLSNANLFELVPAAEEIWDFSPEMVNLVAMPLFHIGGGGWAVAGMVYGCTSVIVRDLDPAALIGLIGEKRITHGFLVPAVLQFMLMMPGVAEADYSSLHLLVYGASPISEEVLAKSVKTFGCQFWQTYGLTETTGAIVNLPPSDHDPEGPNRHRLRSCGLPGPGVEIRIVDSSTFADLPTGDVGEIWIRSPQVMVGYWRQPEETTKAIVDGWFRTGDAGFLDADGYLYIHDRVKDMIVSGGENVYPAEVENVLMAHPAVADAAVIGVPHEKWGETAKAVLVKAPGAEATDEEIMAYCRDHLAKFKCPTSVDWVEVLPRNPSGKILKKDLRAPYWAGRDRNVN